MIFQNSKELPFLLPVTEGKVAFIGDKTHCSNYAGRFHKHSKNVEFDNALSVNIIAPSHEFPTVSLYWCGSFVDNTLDFPIQEGTKYFVVVTDSARERGAIIDFLFDTYDDIEVFSETATDSAGLTDAHKLLADSDHTVLRELERMFLSGTTINRDRELYRANIDTAISEVVVEDELTEDEYLNPLATFEQVSDEDIANEPIGEIVIGSSEINHQVAAQINSISDSNL